MAIFIANPLLEIKRLKKSFESLTKQNQVLDRQIELEKQKLVNLQLNSKERLEEDNDIVIVPEVKYSDDLNLKLSAASIYGESAKRLMKLYKKNNFSKAKLSEKEKPYVEEMIKEDIKVLSKIKK